MPSTATKIELGVKSGDNYPVYWSEGDQVSINGTLSAKVTGADNGASTVHLSSKVAAAQEYKILYPGERDNSTTVTIPAVQKYSVRNSFDPAALPLCAKVGNFEQPVRLNYLASVLRFTFKVTEPKAFDMLEIENPADGALSGTYEVDFENSALGEASNTSKRVSLKFDKDQPLDPGTYAFCVVIPAGTYSDGLNARLYDADGQYMDLKAKFDGALEKGHLYDFPTKPFVPEGRAILIPDADSWIAMSTTIKKQIVDVILTGDLDFSGKSYSSFSFYGSFDGRGHKITGLTTSLFDELRGSARNVEITADIRYTGGGQDYGIGILAHYVYLKTSGEYYTPDGDTDQVVERITTKGSIHVDYSTNHNFHVGGIVGSSNGIPLSNCTNEASITVDKVVFTNATAASSLRIGGISGALQELNSASVTYCTNTGEITVEEADNVFDFQVGGIAGFSSQPVTLLHVTNSGAVTANTVGCQNLYLSGVFGYSSHDGVEIEYATNTGTVTSSEDIVSEKTFYAGGVVAHAGFATDHAENKGNVIINGTSNGTVNIGGCFGYTNKRQTNTTHSKGNVTVTVKPGSANNIYAGGVVGYTSGVLEDASHSAGNVSYTGDANTRQVYAGGITGANKNSMTRCSNTASGSNVIINGTNISEIHIGGVTGDSDGVVMNCNNSAEVIVGENTVTTAYSYIGGIVGYVRKQINGCTNSGKVSFLGKSGGNTTIGGIFGRSLGTLTTNVATGVRNTADIEINTATQSGCYIYIGGVAGHLQAGTISGVNEGVLNVTKIACNRLFVGGCVGIIAGSSETGQTIENTGNVIVAKGVTPADYINVGGAFGRTEGKITLTASNSGNVTNSASSNANVYVGGLIGQGAANNDNTLTLKDCTNTGNVINNQSNTNKVVRMGGIAGSIDKQANVSNCTNGVAGDDTKGQVSNTGSTGTGIISIGGICGYSTTASDATIYRNCINYGSISNSGTSTSEKGVCIAGLVGNATGLNDMSASGENKNVNNGAITETSESPCPIVGGVCGYSSVADSKFSNCVNNGNLVVENSVKTIVRVCPTVGGVLGWHTGGNMSDASNTGNIDLRKFTVSNSFCIGGVVGSIIETTKDTFENLTNSGTIKARDVSQSNQSYFCYVGGICSGARYAGSKTEAQTNRIYKNCTNTGNIDMGVNGRQGITADIPAMIRAGGIAAYANINAPAGTTLRCEADITAYSTLKKRNQIGGIFGYFNVTTISNCIYKGTMWTNSSAYGAFLGGIVGNIKGNSTKGYKIQDCKVKGQIVGTGSGDYMAGLLCSTEASCKVDFVDCQIENGTTWTTTPLQTGDELKREYLCGASHGTGTITNCSVVESID